LGKAYTYLSMFSVPRRLSRLRSPVCGAVIHSVGAVRFIGYHADKSAIDNIVRMERMRRRGIPVGEVERELQTPSEVMDPNAVFKPEIYGHEYQRKVRMGEVVSQLVQEFILAEQKLQPSEFVKYKIAEIDPITSGFQIRGVRVSDNCAHCTVRWCCYNRIVTRSTDETQKLRTAIAEVLERVKPKLRHKIGAVLNYRYVPTISFVYDFNVGADRAKALASVAAMKQIEEELKVLLPKNPI